MKLGIFAKTFSHLNTVDAIYEAVKKHRITGIHYNMVCSGLSELPAEIADIKIQEIQEALNKHHLEMVGLSATFNMIDSNLEHRKEGLKSLDVLSKAAKAMGTNFVSLCTGTRHADKWTWHPKNNSKSAWKDLLSSMEKAINIAENYDIVLGIEPETANVVQNAQAARKLIDQMGSPRLRVILDPANLFEHAEDQQKIRDLIKESLDLLHDRMEVAHAKDRNLAGVVKPAGQGVVDFPFFIDLLNQAGFSGPLVMHGLTHHDVNTAASHIIKLL